MTRPDVLAIVGPTAVGKSAVAEGVALALGGQIVSADSMQVYRGMDIGTAKTPPRERRVPYHCVDLVGPDAAYSAALYQRDARNAIAVIRAEGDLPVVVGGTGLYVRAALDEMDFPAGEAESPLREQLERLAADVGPQALHARLEAVDPDAAALIHPNNVRRVVRALEMAESGRPYGAQAARFSERRAFYPRTLLVGITMDREQLYCRVDSRVDAMLEGGLLDEVRRLLAEGHRHSLTSAQAIGYKELVAVLDGKRTLEDAASAVKQATRRYVKRQLTWFRADPRIVWMDVTDLSPAEAASAAIDLVESYD